MKTTKEGKRFILAAFLITVAALNTGNNLIYLILSLMLSFLAVSVLILRLNLSGLSLEVAVNHPLFAGEENTATILMTNIKRSSPSYSVHVLSSGAFYPLYCALIRPASTLSEEVAVKFERRGLYSYGTFNVKSGFPFILFEKSKSVAVSGQTLVYPSLIEVGDLTGFSASAGQMAAKAAGSGDDIYSLREFRHGDDGRKIHWKASARVSHLLVKEYADYESEKRTIIVDNIMGGDNEVFEKVVSLSASVAKYFISRGDLVKVITCKKVIPFGRGDEHLFRILDLLAVIGEEGAWDNQPSSERDGYIIAVLKSSVSLSGDYAAQGNMVIYADSI